MSTYQTRHRLIRCLKFSVTALAALTLVATVLTPIQSAFAATKYRVTYDANGATAGSVPVDNTPYNPGDIVTVRANTGSLVKTGFVFSGWNSATNGSGTNYPVASTFAIGSDMTLYAKWLTAYTVTYNGNGNTGGTAPVDPSSPYASGATVTVLGNTGALTKTGYTFNNWNTAADGSGISRAPAATFAIGANTTLYAQWAPVIIALAVIPDPQTLNYGDPVPSPYTFVLKDPGNNTVDPATLTNYTAPVCTSSYAVPTHVSASTLTITCSGGSADNRTFNTSATALLTINKAILTVTPDAKSRNYGQAPPTYTFGVIGFVNGETLGTIGGYVAPVCTSTYTVTTPLSSSPVDITCSGGSANDYVFNTSATAHLTIGAATLTILPYAQPVDYGDPVPTYGFGILGFMNDEDTTTASGYVAPTCDSTYAVTTPVSSSPLDITCSGGSADNYTFDTTATAHVTISKATLTVTPDAKPVDYGDAVPTYSFGVTGFMNGENEGTASGYVAPTCDSTYAVTTPVSSSPLDITCSGGSADNYTFDTTATAHVTISKAPLTVTPDNKSVHYGDAPPTYTFDVNGFVNSENAGSAGGYVAPTCNSTYTSSTSVSLSPVDITCSGGSADNYTFDTTATAHATISKAHTSVSYNGSQLVLVGTNATLALIFSGPSGCTGTWTYTFDPAVSGSPFSYSSPGGSHSISTTGWGSGVYSITVTYSGDVNCELSTDDTGTLTVASPGDNAYGGGWSTYNGFGKANFGFEVHAQPNTQPVVYKGQLVWNLKNYWRFKGTLDNYGTALLNSVQTGIATGTGTLYWWDWSLNYGYGGWAFAGSSVHLTITFTATTPSTKKKSATTGTFGINVEFTPTGGQPALPTSVAQSLKGGSIKLS